VSLLYLIFYCRDVAPPATPANISPAFHQLPRMNFWFILGNEVMLSGFLSKRLPPKFSKDFASGYFQSDTNVSIILWVLLPKAGIVVERLCAARRQSV
jgi:hypothetical protein